MPTYLPRLLFIICLPAMFGLGYAMTRHGPPKSSIIKIEAAPEGAKTSIDGKRSHVGENKAVPGKHTITISRDGFKQQSKSTTTGVGEIAYIGVALTPNSSETSNWYDDHPNDQKLSDGIASHSSDYTSEKASQKNTLLQQLPLSFGGASGEIKLESGIPIVGSSEPAVYVTAATPGDRQSVLAWMRNNGYEPANMDMVFNDINTTFLSQENR
jgi:hypothetical protein